MFANLLYLTIDQKCLVAFVALPSSLNFIKTMRTWMKRIVVALGFVFFLLILKVNCQDPQGSESIFQTYPLIQALQSAQRTFSSNLILSILNDNQRQQGTDTKLNNVVVSPFSVYVVLSMTLIGAKEETQREMIRALGLNSSTWAQIISQFSDASNLETNPLSQYILQLNATDILQLANGLFVDKGYKLNPLYTAVVAAIYSSPVTQADFAHNAEQERMIINSWVAEKTNNLIHDLIPTGSLTVDTKLVLINAIHFLGSWKIPFDEKLTSSQPFRHLVLTQHSIGTASSGASSSVSSTTTANVDTMVRAGVHEYYGEDESYKWLVRPYSKEDYEMVFIIPKSNIELNLETEKQFDQWLSQKLLSSNSFGTSNQQISMIRIPKFKIEYETEMSQLFQQAPFNMTTAFSKDSANFNGMLTEQSIQEGDRLWIDKIFHKAYLKVDEKGTEAAAATAVIIVGRTTSIDDEEQIDFIIDRPFAFVLRHAPSGIVLFTGKVNSLP